jgi:hypothetical protein
LKNFKYEVGLTRRQSDFIRGKLLFKEVYSFVQFINKFYSPSSKPSVFNLTPEMIYCLKRLYLEVLVMMRDSKL